MLVGEKRIARVFPRVTKATPDDPLCFYGLPKEPLPEVDEVHVSITFTYDLPAGEYLAKQWAKTGIPVKVGGPAYGKPAHDFIPGLYMKKDWVITSRGCINNCWFCRVHKVQGGIIELPITDGHIIQDDNLLACSENHIRSVFEMLKRQKDRPIFNGGLEAKLIKPWHIELLKEVKAKEMFFAYDTPDDYEPLAEAGKLLDEAGFTLRSRKKFCYVLIGYPGDTYSKAETRLINTLKAGFMPFAMLYKDECGFEDSEWRKFQRVWCRPAIIVSSNKEYFKKQEAHSA